MCPLRTSCGLQLRSGGFLSFPQTEFELLLWVVIAMCLLALALSVAEDAAIIMIADIDAKPGRGAIANRLLAQSIGGRPSACWPTRTPATGERTWADGLSCGKGGWSTWVLGFVGWADPPFSLGSTSGAVLVTDASGRRRYVNALDAVLAARARAAAGEAPRGPPSAAAARTARVRRTLALFEERFRAARGIIGVARERDGDSSLPFHGPYEARLSSDSGGDSAYYATEISGALTVRAEQTSARPPHVHEGGGVGGHSIYSPRAVETMDGFGRPSFESRPSTDTAGRPSIDVCGRLSLSTDFGAE